MKRSRQNPADMAVFSDKTETAVSFAKGPGRLVFAPHKWPLR
jgi:hypothetical protein